MLGTRSTRWDVTGVSRGCGPGITVLAGCVARRADDGGRRDNVGGEDGVEE
jgi:hypothetical protein